MDPGSVIRKSVFSIVAYHEVLKRKGGDISRFDKEVDTKFKKGPRGLWDLHSSDALNQVKMQLPSGSVDANFCPCCAFWSTNNETLNNHVRKHYGMGLTCRADGFTTASMAAMKAHMESEHGYEGKHAGAVKKLKGKG